MFSLKKFFESLLKRIFPLSVVCSIAYSRETLSGDFSFCRSIESSRLHSSCFWVRTYCLSLMVSRLLL